jgi:hypothetical protein
VARLAGDMVAMGLTHRRPQCVLHRASFLPVACQLVKRYWSDISVSVAVQKAETLTFN